MIHFLAHMHPLLVHLPIGFLILAALLKLASVWGKIVIEKQLLFWIITLTLAAAIASALTGYLLKTNDALNTTTSSRHQWAGMGLIAVLLGLLIALKQVQKPLFENALWLLSLILLFYTGHLGGSLTHGEEYFSFSTKKYIAPMVKDPLEANLYVDVIEPIFADKCWECHSSKKIKGGLRLDDKEWVIKGGENGSILSAHEPELMKRILLGESNEDHMPPKEKPQLSEQERKLIAWWIKKGANFEGKVKDLSPEPAILAAINSLSKKEIQISLAPIPSQPIAAADPLTLDTLRQLGFPAKKIAHKSNYLYFNEFNRQIPPKVWQLLSKLSTHLVWLKIPNQELNQETIGAINQLKNLYVLDVNHAKVDQKLIKNIGPLPQLLTLNISHTVQDSLDFSFLKNLPKLQKLYIYPYEGEIAATKAKYPSLSIETGQYKVPIFESDTTIFARSEIEK